jgi:hypothetical protein
MSIINSLLTFTNALRIYNEWHIDRDAGLLFLGT